MTARLPAGLVVAALLRRVNDTGGLGVVRARGDAQAGAILLLEDDGAGGVRVLERGIAADGRPGLVESRPPGDDAEAYWRRRRDRDPDLWVVELSIPASERLGVLTMMAD